ncbi:uncharacterized protein LOC114259599 [Camellia sinensis]|uniref:uncharacterized protein LOC114259599 n=1 Tax=Camellia sinensis TaxID=4442 RepID=UPI0010360294|nr:uncharacterized protein LOC114259599 [Camellia sinensis]
MEKKFRALPCIERQKDGLEVLKLPTYADVVDRAYIAEKWIKASHSGEINQKKRFWERDNRRSGAAPRKKVNTTTTRSGNEGPINLRGDTIPNCPMCGKAHWGQCHRSTGACFKCGQVGHLLRDYPKLFTNPTGSSELASTPAVPGGVKKDQKRQRRAFSLVSGNLEVTENVVSGTLFVYGHLAHVLIDSGSIHHFVAPHLVSKLASIPEPLGYILSVSFPSGDSTLGTDVYKSCTISLKGETLYIDLISLRIGNFDVILGMDWLAANQASIDCKAKKRPPYLMQSSWFENFRMLEDLPGTPVDREIEFIIEIQPGI